MSIPRTRPIRLFLVLIASLVALAACSSANNEPTTAETQIVEVEVTRIVEGTPVIEIVTQEVEVTRIVEAEVEAEPTREVELVYGDLPRNETFIVASQAPNNDVWDSFNNFQTSTFNNAGGYQNMATEVPFIEWNAVIYPWLAQSWAYNEDGTQMTLTITEGANWSDGEPLTIDDWLFTLQYAKDNMDKGIMFATFLKDVEWEAVGSNQIVFTLPKTNYRFHQNFVADISFAFTPVPQHIWEGQDPVTFKNPEAIGSGPYRLVSTSNETRTVIWERRDDYWNEDAMPAPRYQVWTKRPEPDVAVFEWEDGSYDLGRMPGQLVTRMVQTNPNLEFLIHQDPCPRGLVFNVESGPLADPAFRAAMSLLIDREKVANLANVPGYVSVVMWPNTGEIDENYYDPAAAEAFDVSVFDPEKAAQILDEAGYPLVDGKRVDKDGNPISLDALYIDVGNPAWTVWAWLLSEQAQLVGIDVNARLLDIPTFFTMGAAGEFDILFRWFCARPSDPLGGMYAGLHSKLLVPIGEPSAGIPGRYGNPEMDALLDQLSAGDPADPASQELFRKAYALWAEDKPYVPLYGDSEGVVFNSEYWTGLEVGQPWVHWGNHFRQMLTYIEPSQ